VVATLGLSIATVAVVAPQALANTGGYPWASATCQTTPLTYKGVQYCTNDNWVYNGGLYDTWRYNYRNCTSWVAWRLWTNNGYTMPRAIGDASAWGSYFATHGHVPNNEPAPGAIAWESGGDHVAYVESVSADGSQVTISEYNEGYYPGQPTTGDGLYDVRTVPSGDFKYIHVKDLSASPVIGVVTSNGEVLAKEGSLSASWTDEYNGASSVAVATDSTHGPLIAVLTSSGKVLAKEGSLSASWTDEYNGASSVAVASDPTHGPLIATYANNGEVLAKEGSLSASWTDEYNGVVRVAVASDPTHGPLIATYANNGEVLAKEGSLSASWTDEYKLLPFIAVASDPTHGPLIAVWSGNGEALAKEGSLSASWTDEYNGVVRVAVAG
jgi:surface antigen